jgi:hypothetical protein
MRRLMCFTAPAVLLIAGLVWLLAGHTFAGGSAQSDINGASATGKSAALQVVPVGGGWQSFTWSGCGNVLTTNGPFTFTNSSPVVLTVVDAFCRGDQFRVLDNGLLVGVTSLVTPDLTCANQIGDPDAALADPTYSRGTFKIQPGSHSINFQLVQNPFCTGSAFFRLDFCTPPPPQMTNWWPFDGNFLDIQNFGTGNVAFGDPIFAPGKVADAVSFDGGSDGNPDAVVFNTQSGNFAASNFTIDFWIQTSTARLEAILNKRDLCAFGNFWDIRKQADGRILFEIDQSGPGDFFSLMSTTSINDGNFHHVAIVRAGTSITIYIDGVASGSGTAPSIISVNNNAFLIAGSDVCVGTDGTQAFTGKLDELEFFSRALAVAEIQAIVNAGIAGKCKGCITPPAGLTSWYPFQNNTVDVVGGINGTAQNGALFGPAAVGQGLALDGVNDFVSAPDAPANDFTGSFSIDAWIRLRAYSPEFAPIVSKWNDLGVAQRSYFVAVLPNGTVRFDVSTNGLFAGTNSAIVISAVVVPLNTYAHITATFDSATQTLSIYVNGVLSGQTVAPFSTVFSNNEPLLIGAGDLGSNVRDFTNGFIDEVELFNRALTQAEAQSIFNAGSQGKCLCQIVGGLCNTELTFPNTPNLCGANVQFPLTTAGSCSGFTACFPPSGNFFPVGSTQVNCFAEGTNGVEQQCSFVVTVQDVQPPTITCPANVTATTAVTCPSSASAVVNFPPPTASDNCPGVTTMCNPPSGSIFPVGTTTVTCTATDASGNTAMCSFTVTVFDTCLQDDSNPSTVLLINSFTGEYRFCCAGAVFSGTGLVTVKGCILSLQHNPPDRRVLATIDKSVFRGTASLQSPPGTIKCTITDRDLRNNTCTCQ